MLLGVFRQPDERALGLDPAEVGRTSVHGDVVGADEGRDGQQLAQTDRTPGTGIKPHRSRPPCLESAKWSRVRLFGLSHRLYGLGPGDPLPARLTDMAAGLSGFWFSCQGGIPGTDAITQ